MTDAKIDVGRVIIGSAPENRPLAVGAKHLRMKTLILPINWDANASPFSDLCKKSNESTIARTPR